VTHTLALDVSSLIYRAHFAMPDSVRAPDGRRVGAVHGYLDMVTRLLVSRRPTDAVHVYDHDWRPTARTDLYPAYKANRPPEPEELTVQFALLRDVLNLTGMPQAHSPDWEAEDAIGGLVRKADAGDLLEMVSGDRDLLQLVRDAPSPVRLLFTVRGVSELHEFDEAAVVEKYGVPADRYAEFAILRGDPSDELPGVPGVGEKTARALVQAYPSLDAMLADAASDGPPSAGPFKGKPALRARMREATGYLAVMRELVPVNADAPLAVWSGTRDDAAAKALADRHGLRGPMTRLLAALDSTGNA
jgi:5'-3' exonuclease